MHFAELPYEMRLILPANVGGDFVEGVVGVGESRGSFADAARTNPIANRVPGSHFYRRCDVGRRSVNGPGHVL